MKRIQNLPVRLPPHLHKEASAAGIAVVDTAGIYVTTAHFLCGTNPWGLHQDYHFSQPFSEVRRGARITATAQRAIDKDLDFIDLSDEDHATLMKILHKPSPSAKEKLSPDLARHTLPLMEAIEFSESPEEAK